MKRAGRHFFTSRDSSHAATDPTPTVPHPRATQSTQGANPGPVTVRKFIMLMG